MSRICPQASAMEITQQLREAAEGMGQSVEETAEAGLAEKSTEFREAGGEIYS